MHCTAGTRCQQPILLARPNMTSTCYACRGARWYSRDSLRTTRIDRHMPLDSSWLACVFSVLEVQYYCNTGGRSDAAHNSDCTSTVHVAQYGVQVQYKVVYLRYLYLYRTRTGYICDNIDFPVILYWKPLDLTLSLSIMQQFSISINRGVRGVE